MKHLRSEELMRKFQEGKVEAFDCLWVRHCPEIQGFHELRLRMNGFNGDIEQEAQDLTNETFMRVISRKYQWNPEKGTFVSWLYTIANNTRISFFRSVRYKLQGLFVPLLDLGITSIRANPSALDQRLDVESAVAQLPQDVQDVIVLCYYEQLTDEEVSNILSIPPGTVASRKSRGKRLLSNAFNTRKDTHT